MDVKNKKYDAFMRSHRHWRHSSPRARIAWSEEKKKLRMHLIESARLLAKLTIPFMPDQEQLEEFENNGYQCAE